jgi:hypothetical protein
MVGAEGAQAYSRHPRSGVKRPLRDRGWIDSTGSRPVTRAHSLHPSFLETLASHRREPSDVFGAKKWQWIVNLIP